MAIAQAHHTRADKVQTRSPGSTLRTIAFTALAGLFALASFLALEGLTEGLMPWTIIGCPGCTPGVTTTPELLRWHGAEHGATVGLLFGGSLLALLWRARAKPLLLQFYALGHVVLVLLYGVFGQSYNSVGALVGFAVLVGVTTGLLIATYPAAREVFSFRRTEPASRPLLALAVAAALALAPTTMHRLVWQVQGVGGESAVHARWTGGVILAVCLVLAGLLTATKRPGWRALGILTGITYLYLGAAALTVPDQAGSWGVPGGLLALLGGMAYIAVTTLEGRRAVQAPAPSPPLA
jgi:hypothetical protein